MNDATPGTVDRPSPGAPPRPDSAATRAASLRPLLAPVVLLIVACLGIIAVVATSIGIVPAPALPSPAAPSGEAGAFVGPASPTPVVLDRDTAVRPVAAAPALRLTDHEGRPFDLASLRGEPVLVFFGYTHCPDVCPTNLADTRAALRLVDQKVGVVFVTIDPARDDAAAMKQYVDYYRSGYIGLTGTDAQIADAAGAWGVSYARVESTAAAGYAMAHTADTFLVDAQGRLRDIIWFGAGPEIIAARISGLATEAIESPASTATPASPATGATATAAPTPATATTVRARLESSIVRAGRNRIVVSVSDQSNRDMAKPDVVAHFSFRSATDPALAPVDVTGIFVWVVRGEKAVYIADMTLPSAGRYNATITLDGPAGRIGSASLPVSARAQGPTPQIGEVAPSVRTPIAADVGGDLRLISSDAVPDERFYQHSVDELLAAHEPFVLILYSPTFCPTTACGPLLEYMKEVADEIPPMTFVHAEPYAMTDVGGQLQPEIDGSKFRYAPWSVAYGLPFEPFVFVVGPDGRILASFEVIVGSNEIRAAIGSAIGQ